MSENEALSALVQAQFKKPRVLPTLVCGVCGHEMLPQRGPELTQAEVTLTCYAPRCAQRGRMVLVPLRERIDVKVLE